MAKGDHIYVVRKGYAHEGIDCGDATVIHYSGRPWARNHTACVERIPLKDFARGKDVHVVSYEGEFRFPADEVVRRAESRLGERSYNVLTNNCEHFARWAVSGEARSTQIATVGVTLGLTLGMGAVLWLASKLR